MFKRLLYCFLLLLVFCSSASYAALTTIGTNESIAPENSPLMAEIYRIRIPNIKGGSIEVSSNKGSSWQTIGQVLLPADKVSDQGYTASRWVENGDIAAVAVNSIHIKTGFNTADDRGIIFSILPAEQHALLPKTQETSKDSSAIYTDIKSGNSLFGGGVSPFVGNKVSIVDVNGEINNIGEGFRPSVGDLFLIIVEKPVRYPKEIVFENRFGGLIQIKYADGETRYIGQVLRPIEGVGRFIGSEYADVGRIRANHAGVICISTSPLGYIGGFQIIPAGHGMSKEMVTARTLTQWMVIGPVNALDPSFEGLAPFFKYFLQPRYNEDDIDQPDWEKRLLGRFLVEVKYKDKNEWEPMPAYYMKEGQALPRWANTAMENVSHVRIMFPVYSAKLLPN